jgi:hypothetical protein
MTAAVVAGPDDRLHEPASGPPHEFLPQKNAVRESNGPVTPGPRLARASQFASSSSQLLGPSSAFTGSTRHDPHELVYSRPFGSIWSGPPGCVPSMNHDVVTARVHGPGAPPVHASMVALTTPFGALNLASGQPFV